MTIPPPLPTASLPPPKPRQRRRWLTLLLASLIFLAGLTVGTAATTLYIVHRYRYALHHPEELPDRLAARLTRRLGLSATQESQVRDILADRQARFRDIRRQFQPQVESELRGVHSDISALLTPTQQSRWDALYDDLQRNWLPPPVR